MTGSLASTAGAFGSAIFPYWVEEDSDYNETLVANVYNTSHGTFSKPATVGSDAGADGWAIYSIDFRRWEVVWMNMPGMFYGTLKANLSHATWELKVAVTDVITGYDLWGAAWATANPLGQVVYNPVALSNGPGAIAHWFAGYQDDSVICIWDQFDDRFGILAIEPNQREWVGQTVMIDAAHNAKTIYSPPWAPTI